MNNNIYTLLIYRYYMDFIYEIRLLKKKIEQFEKKLNAVIIELNKINHIATYSDTEDYDDIKYPNDSDYD